MHIAHHFMFSLTQVKILMSIREMSLLISKPKNALSNGELVLSQVKVIPNSNANILIFNGQFQLVKIIHFL